LSPLHASIAPLEQDKVASQLPTVISRSPEGPKESSQAGIEDAPTEPKSNPDRKSHSNTAHSNTAHSNTAHSVSHGSAFAESTASTTDGQSTRAIRLAPSSEIVRAQSPQNTNSEEILPGLLLSDVGTASRRGDKTLGSRLQCNVFEVVQQRKETTMCPACARCPSRAKLPARRCPQTI
jgi:hypothetical protein